MTKGSTNYTWTRGRLLASVGGTTFEYDAKGRRTKKGSTEYYYDGDRLIAELRPDDTLYYFYDESGTFIKKEDYTETLLGYIAKADPKYGLYPITDELAYILQTAKPGWWDVSHPDYLLTDCNPELGWLFAACYIQ